MKIKEYAFGLSICSLFLSNWRCDGLSLLIPETSQVACIDKTTGAVKWKITIPFKATAQLDLCGDAVRVVDSKNSTNQNSVAFLDKENGRFRPDSNHDCSVLLGTKYSSTGRGLEFFKERWQLKDPVVFGGTMEFVDFRGTVCWSIERKGICDAAFVKDDFVVVGSHEYNPPRRPILSAYIKGAKKPLWIFDLNRIITPKKRQSNYLTATIGEDRVNVFWAGIIFELERSSGKKLRQFDCAKIGLSGEMLNEIGILVRWEESILLFHRQKIICLDSNLSHKLWEYNPDLMGNILPSPVVEGSMIYFFCGLNSFH